MPTGDARTRGFTLVELLVVLMIVALLAALAAPAVTDSVERAREATLREDLLVMRKAIDGYYADRGHYPADLETLVEERYLRSVPVDPVTERRDTWEPELEQVGGKRGIIDIHSGAPGRGRDGTPYGQW